MTAHTKTKLRVGIIVSVVLIMLGVVVVVIAPDSVVRVAGSALFVLGTGQAVITYRNYKKSVPGG